MLLIHSGSLSSLVEFAPFYCRWGIPTSVETLKEQSYFLVDKKHMRFSCKYVFLTLPTTVKIQHIMKML